MIKLFHAPGTRSLRVVWMAEEMGLPIEITPIKITQVEAQRPDLFLAEDPSETWPAMTDGSVTMTESVAILQYLADRYGPTELALKPDEAAYPDYLQFLILGEGSLGAPLAAMIGARFFGPDTARDEWTVGAVVDGFTRRCQLVAHQLEGHQFLAGDRFTAADISVAYALGLGVSLLGLGDRVAPSVVDYYHRMTARPAFQRAAAR